MDSAKRFKVVQRLAASLSVARWIAALSLMTIGVICFLKAAENEGRGPEAALSMLGFAVPGFACLILTAIITSPETVTFFTSPFRRMIDYIYFGDNGDRTPPLNLKWARHYRSEWLLDEAAAEYLRVREWHPQCLEVWVEGILTLRQLGDEEEAAHWVQQSRRHIKDPADRQRIADSMTQAIPKPLDRLF